jgi:hypothetical protein
VAGLDGLSHTVLCEAVTLGLARPLECAESLMPYMNSLACGLTVSMGGSQATLPGGQNRTPREDLRREFAQLPLGEMS